MKPLRIATHQGGDVRGDDEDKTLAISVLLVMLFGTLELLLVTSMVLFYLLAIQCPGRLLRTLQNQLIQNALLSELRIS
jgi:hypothetical protein